MVAKYALEELENLYSISQTKIEVLKHREENGQLCKPTVVEQILDAAKAKSKPTTSLTEIPTMNTADTLQEERDKVFCALDGILEGHEVDLGKEREERISPITSKITQ